MPHLKGAVLVGAWARSVTCYRSFCAVLKLFSARSVCYLVTFYRSFCLFVFKLRRGVHRTHIVVVFSYDHAQGRYLSLAHARGDGITFAKAVENRSEFGA